LSYGRSATPGRTMRNVGRGYPTGGPLRKSARPANGRQPRRHPARRGGRRYDDPRSPSPRATSDAGEPPAARPQGGPGAIPQTVRQTSDA